MRTFTLDDVEEAQAKGAMARHLEECPKGKDAHMEATYEEQCTTVSTFEYAFCPTSIGDVKVLRCLLCTWYVHLSNPEVEA